MREMCWPTEAFEMAQLLCLSIEKMLLRGNLNFKLPDQTILPQLTDRKLPLAINLHINGSSQMRVASMRNSLAL